MHMPDTEGGAIRRRGMRWVVLISSRPIQGIVADLSHLDNVRRELPTVSFLLRQGFMLVTAVLIIDGLLSMRANGTKRSQYYCCLHTCLIAVVVFIVS